MFHFIGHLIFGLFIGLLAKFLVPGEHPGGIIATVLLGMLGAGLGGFIGRALGWYQPGHPAGFVMALLGAVILLVIYHFAFGNRSGRSATTTTPERVVPRGYVVALPMSPRNLGTVGQPTV